MAHRGIKAVQNNPAWHLLKSKSNQIIKQVYLLKNKIKQLKLKNNQIKNVNDKIEKQAEAIQNGTFNL